MSHEEIAFEPIRGLPEALPEGEEILWQGRPDTWTLVKESLALRWVVGYFVLLAVWRVGSLIDLMPLGAALSTAIPFLGLGLLTGAILWLVALVQARSTVYTITSARVVMRIGAALTLTVNLPFAAIGGAQLDLRKRGTGTIALQLTGKTRLSYLVCWPHVRPWHMSPTQPALRCIPHAQAVADILARAAAARIETTVAEEAVPDRGLPAATIAAE
ncbi:MAG: photosynthetic complex putative assembly protein PuhB [Pseudomonadota bacterium]